MCVHVNNCSPRVECIHVNNNIIAVYISKKEWFIEGILLVLLFQYTCNANKPVKITENFNKKW